MEAVMAGNPNLKKRMQSAAMSQYDPNAEIDDDLDVRPPVLRHPDLPPPMSSVMGEQSVDDAPQFPQPSAPKLAPQPSMMDRIPQMGVDPRVSGRYDKVMSRLNAMDEPQGLGPAIAKAIMAFAPAVVAGTGGQGSLAMAGGMAQGNARTFELQHEHEMQERQSLVGESENLAGVGERAREANIRSLQAAAQLEATRAWHEATVGVQGSRVAAQRGNYDAQHTDRLRKIGLDPDGNPIPDEQLSPQERSQIEKNKATVDVTNARVALTQAQTSAIPEKIKIAQQQLSLALSRLQMAQSGLDLRSRAFERDTYGTDRGTPIPGAPMLDGTPVGTKFATAVNPTTATKGAGEQGDIIIQAGNNLKALIDKHRNKLGNMSAVLNSVFNNTPWADKQSSEVISALRSYVALNPRMHGFRGQSALQEFSKIVGGLPKDPDALKAAIDGIAGTASIVSERGRPKLVKPGQPPANPQGGGSSLAAPEEPDFIQDTPGGPVRPNPKKKPTLKKAGVQ